MNRPFYNDVNDSLGFLTITANRLLSGYFRKRLTAAGLDNTAEQWGVLAQIWNQGSIAQDELASILCVDKSSLSRVLDIMERKGLVTRQKDRDDARRKILFSTPLADSMQERCKQVADEVMERVLQGVPEGDLACCIKVLARVKENIRGIQE